MLLTSTYFLSCLPDNASNVLGAEGVIVDVDVHFGLISIAGTVGLVDQTQFVRVHPERAQSASDL